MRQERWSLLVVWGRLRSINIVIIFISASVTITIIAFMFSICYHLSKCHNTNHDIFYFLLILNFIYLFIRYWVIFFLDCIILSILLFLNKLLSVFYLLALNCLSIYLSLSLINFASLEWLFPLLVSLLNSLDILCIFSFYN